MGFWARAIALLMLIALVFAMLFVLMFSRVSVRNGEEDFPHPTRQENRDVP